MKKSVSSSRLWFWFITVEFTVNRFGFLAGKNRQFFFKKASIAGYFYEELLTTRIPPS